MALAVQGALGVPPWHNPRMGDAELWLWHLMHDPIRSNPWSLGVSVLFAVLIVMATAGPLIGWAIDRRTARQETEAGDVKLFHRGDGMEHEAEHVNGRDPRASSPDPAYETLAQPADDPVPSPDPVTDSGVHAAPQRSPAVLSGHKVQCAGCRGYGFVIVSTRDLLIESKALLDDAGEVIVKEFYTRLLRAAPDLASLFPADLLAEQQPVVEDGSHDLPDEAKHEGLLPDFRAAAAAKRKTGKEQREKLLGALLALATLYDPDDEASMEKLTNALQAFGRSHASFARPDGSERGATLDEYAAVKGALFGTLVTTAGPAWKHAYTMAWSEAYDFAAVTMLAEQYRTVSAVARMPRRSAEQPLRSNLT